MHFVLTIMTEGEPKNRGEEGLESGGLNFENSLNVLEDLDKKKKAKEIKKKEEKDHSGNTFGGSKIFPGPAGLQDGRE